MDIIFNDLFQQVSKNKFGITENETIESINSPDSMRKLTLDIGWTYGFFLKKLDSENYLFVTSELRGPECIVGIVFKIPQKIIEQIGTTEPMVVLEQCTKIIGVPIQVGDVKGNFIISETFKIPYGGSPYDFVKNINPEKTVDSGSIIVFMHRQKEEDGTNYLNVEMAFSIDFGKYFEWFKE